MKLTNRHLAYLGISVGAIGLALEWKNLFPSGLKNPLAARNVGTTAADGRKAVSATQATTGRPSPAGTTTYAAGAGVPAGRQAQGSTLTLGSVLTPIASLLGGLLKGSAPTAQPKPSSSGGGGSFGGSPSAPGGSAGRVDAGRGAAFNNDNTSNAGGTGPSAYADVNGSVAYPQGDGTYQDEWGNQVYIGDDGTITYDPASAVGYVDGGIVFPGSYDPNDPATFDFYGDGGPLAAPDPISPVIDSDFFPDGGPLANPDITLDDGFLSGDQLFDLGAVDPAQFVDDGSSDWGGDWGGGGGDLFDDNMYTDRF